MSRDNRWFLLKIVSINEDADSLISFYPDAVDHILAKRRELLRAIEKLDNKVKDRDEQVRTPSNQKASKFCT